jgi:hypothetical protein
MLPAAGGIFRPGPNGPPGAGRDWKVAPPSVVDTMAGQSRKPQGKLPSNHQWLALTAVNDDGTNPESAEAVGPGEVVIVEREVDEAAVGDVAGAERADPPQPANNPVAANIAAPIASTVNRRLLDPKFTSLRLPAAIAEPAGPLPAKVADRPITADKQFLSAITSETSTRPARLRVRRRN